MLNVHILRDACEFLLTMEFEWIAVETRLGT